MLSVNWVELEAKTGCAFWNDLGSKREAEGVRRGGTERSVNVFFFLLFEFRVKGGNLS